jgi:hypothetical protein
MAEIVLLYNHDLNETEVTRELAKILRFHLKSRGHKVRVVELPKECSSHYTMKIAPEERRKSNPFKNFISALKSNSPQAIVVDLHTTPDSEWLPQFLPKRDFSKIRKFRAESFEDQWPISRPNIGPIGLDFLPNYGIYYAEIPAKYIEASEEIQKLAPKPGSISFWNLRQHYYFQQADLRKTKAANYLSRLVIRKLAHLIDQTANTLNGRYRVPRRKRHKSRVPRRPRVRLL